jgi:hypothetical protein
LLLLLLLLQTGVTALLERQLHSGPAVLLAHQA